MMNQPSWAVNRQRYDAYSLRDRRNGHYPAQPASVRPPRRGPIPGPIRNPVISYRGTPTSSQSNATNKNIKHSPKNSKPLCTPTQIPKPAGCTSSLSLVDLSPVSIKPEVLNPRSESATSLHTRLRKVKIESEKVDQVSGGDGLETGSGRRLELWSESLVSENLMALPDTSRAASLVCRALVINAWRRRREDNSQLQETIQKLTQQVDHLHIQIVVLRRLLDTENGRVGKFMTEIQRLKAQFEDVTRDRDALKLEKEKGIEDGKQLRDAAEKKSVETENLRNELFTVQNQLQALDRQITRDREKLLKLREDKKILLDKIATTEALAAERLAKAEAAAATVEDLQGRLNAQIALLATVHEQQRKTLKEVKVKTEETMKMQKKFQGSQENAKVLSLRAINLEKELSNRDAALRCLESAYNSQLSELNDLRDRLARQSQEGGWSTRVLQIAGSVVRAPRAIFRTLSYLSNPGPSVVS